MLGVVEVYTNCILAIAIAIASLHLYLKVNQSMPIMNRKKMAMIDIIVATVDRPLP